MQLHIGDAFWWSADQNKQDHLHVIVTEPNKDSQILLVNFSHCYDKERPNQWQDKSCIIEIGEHTNIKKKSIVKYDMAVLVPIDFIAKQIELGIARKEKVEPFPEHLISRILEGGRISTTLKPKYYWCFNRKPDFNW